MKAFLIIFACLVSFGAVAQEESGTRVLDKSEFGCIIPLKTIEPVAFVWDVDAYYKAQIVTLSYESVVNVFGEPFGSMVIDEDLPFVHTLTGSVYTFDYLRHTARP